MPANLVKTPKEDRLWAKARERAAKAGHAGNWKYINSIYQTMKGKKKMSKAAFLGVGQIFRKRCRE